MDMVQKISMGMLILLSAANVGGSIWSDKSRGNQITIRIGDAYENGFKF